ncbi:MAG: PKD domain-containing protein [Bacteroidia bacterium]|nr:PKD domain-containing protein [Bacteroidia bacterium]
MKKNVLLLIALVFISGLSFSQGQASWWYFGANAGLNFNPNPTPVAGGQINTIEGVAAISTPGGQLLFYTDGMRVWNRNHAVMPNGNGLMGSSSSSQSGVIVQRPGSPNLYFVFTADAQAGANGLRWSEVDMNLSAGFGDVTANKNILLYTPTTERICAVRHCNNVDVWVISHHWGTNEFRAYLVTAAGVNPVAVVSAIGPVHSGSNTSTIGYLKVSPDGSKLAMAIRYSFTGSQPGWCELYDFNNATGAISNLVNLGNHSYAYGCEFSPDNRLLYTTSSQPGTIYQYNLCAGSSAAIVASRLTIGNSASGWIGPLQLGPDGKIYNARYQVQQLGVIQNPNTLGVGCAYIDNGQALLNMSTLGLPNFVADYFRIPPVISATMNCLTGNFSYTYTQSGCNPQVPTQSWNFGDPGSGPNNTSTSTTPTHVFSGPGNYIVTLVTQYTCWSDTDTIAVTAISCGPTVTVQGASICQNSCTTLTANASGGTPPYTYAWTPNIGVGPGPHNVCPATTTTYTVIVTDGTGATMSTTATITVNPAPAATATSTNPLCNGGTGTATALAGPYTYSWSTNPVQTTQTATGLTPGNYTVTVTDANGCSDTAIITISQPPLLTALASNTPETCVNSANGTVTAAPSGGTGPYTYSWNTNPVQTTATATGLSTGTYTVTITDANGCSTTAVTTLSAPTGLQPTVAAPQAICISQCATLTANITTGNAPYTYLWMPGNQTGQSIQACPTTTGVYTVTVTDASGCTGTTTVTVNVRPPLSVSANPAGPVCPGSPASLTANGSGGDGGPYNFNWMPGNLNGSPVTVNPTTTTTYTVIITDNCGSPSVTSTVTVNVFALPQVAFAGDTLQGCAPLCVNFTNNTPNAATCSWIFGNNMATSANCSEQYCFNAAGTYNVTLTVTDGNGCINTQTLTNYITVFPVPSAQFSMSSSQVTMLEPNFCFTDMSTGATSWLWNFGDGNDTTQQNPCHAYADTGSYCITLEVENNEGCRSQITYCVEVDPEVAIYVPSAFTPNGDANNELFLPEGIGVDSRDFHMWIFDRWGNLIWETNQWGKGWDGKANGGSKIAQEDVYVWKIECVDQKNYRHQFVGHVSLIR